MNPYVEEILTHAGFVFLFGLAVGIFIMLLFFSTDKKYSLLSLWNLLPNHKLSPVRLWFRFWNSGAGYESGKVIAIVLFYLGFIPKTTGYANGSDAPSLEGAGYLEKSQPDEMEYVSYWFNLPLEYLHDKEGKLKKEYW